MPIDSDWWHEPLDPQERLFDPPAISTPLILIDPAAISVENVSVRRLVHLQREMSRVTWRPSPGRNLAFIVTHEQWLLGIGFLSSPVFALAPRDAFLDLSSDKRQRGTELRQYADLSVCVGAQPAAWHWNLGKLIASIATTLTDYWQTAYGDELLGLTTTSVWGRGSQYNRLWKLLGYTKGFGNCHIPDHVYRNMIDWMDAHGVERHHHTESHVRMRNVGRFRRALADGDTTTLTQFHGQKRAIYYAPAVPASDRASVIDWWFARWGLPRYTRTKDLVPPYTTGRETGGQP